MSEPLEPGPKRPDPKTFVPLTLEQALGAAAMALLCLITLGNVLVRYFTHVSFAFTEEFSVALLVMLAFLGSSVAFAADRHIRITFFIERLSPRLRAACEWLAFAASAGVFGLLAVLGGQLAFDEYRFEVTSPGLGLPQWLYTVWMPVLSAVIGLRVLGRAWRFWQGRA